MMASRTVIFTGISGISHEECLKRLRQQLNSNWEIHSFERKMVEIEMKEKPYRGFRQILLDPPVSQQNLWKEAFNQTVQETKAKERVLLTLHAVYYHQDKCEFVSPIDFKLLEKMKGKAEMLIVLIDDIYDIYRRLIYGGMYQNVLEKKKLEALYASIINLICLLHWREIETAVSRIIAGILGIPILVVATKHSIRTLRTLVESSSDSVKLSYLGHPISTIRETAIDDLPNFTGELNAFVETFLQKCSDSVVFLPSTIDELRIKQKEKHYVPEFLPRWPLPCAKEDYICPHLSTKAERLNPLNPLNYQVESKDVGTSISYLLRVLVDHISPQITSRDLTLVEQSKSGVICYKPHFPSKLSGGARRELEYNYKLQEEHGEASRHSFVFSTQKDKAKWRIRKLVDRVKRHIQLNETMKGKLDEVLEKWLLSRDEVNFFADSRSIVCAAIRDKLQRIVLGNNYKFKPDFVASDATSLPDGAMGKEEKEREIGWQKICTEVEQDELNRYIINDEEYLIAPLGEDSRGAKEFMEKLCAYNNCP